MIRDLVGGSVALAIIGGTTAGFLALAAQGNHQYRLAHHGEAATKIGFLTNAQSKCAVPGKLHDVEAKLPHAPRLLHSAAYTNSHSSSWRAAPLTPTLHHPRPIAP